MGMQLLLEDIVETLRGRSSRRVAYHRLGPDRVVRGCLGDSAFAVEESYFEIRLAEMRIAKSRQFFRSFLPMCAVLVNYLHDGDRRNVPVIVDNEIIRAGLEKAEARDSDFELANTHLVGPVPLMDDRLGLFVGLFRTERNDYASMLLNMLAELPGLGEAEAAARTGYDAVRRLLGCDSVEALIGRRSEFRLGGAAAEPLENTYLAYINDDGGAIPTRELWVVDGTLHRGATPDSASPLDGVDYCLVALECRGSREHYSDLAFHDQWREVRDLVTSGNVERAEKYAWLRLIGAIKSCADLTPRDRSVALFAYRLLLEREIEDYLKATVPVRAGGPVRSARGGRSSGKAALLSGAKRLAVQGTSAERSFVALADLYSELRSAHGPIAKDATMVGADTTFDDVIMRLRESGVTQTMTPDALQEAFVAETYARA